MNLNKEKYKLKIMEKVTPSKIYSKIEKSAKEKEVKKLPLKWKILNITLSAYFIKILIKVLFILPPETPVKNLKGMDFFDVTIFPVFICVMIVFIIGILVCHTASFFETLKEYKKTNLNWFEKIIISKLKVDQLFMKNCYEIKNEDISISFYKEIAECFSEKDLEKIIAFRFKNSDFLTGDIYTGKNKYIKSINEKDIKNKIEEKYIEITKQIKEREYYLTDKISVEKRKSEKIMKYKEKRRMIKDFAESLIIKKQNK